MRGREHPIVLPDALHVIMMFPWCSRLCIRLPQRDAYPSGCDGIEPARGLCLQGLGLSTFDTHPTILFWLGNRRPRDGRTDALLLAWYQQFSGCTPRAVTCSFCGRLSHRPPTERALKLSARVGGLSVADVPLGAVTDHFGLVRPPGGFLRRRSKKHTSPPSKGEKEVNLFNDASVQKKHH